MVKETCHEILRYFSQEYFLLEENFTKQFENFSTNEIIALMRFIHLRTSLSSISSIFSSFSFCFPFLPLLFIFSLYFLSLFFFRVVAFTFLFGSAVFGLWIFRFRSRSRAGWHDGFWPRLAHNRTVQEIVK